MSGLPNSGGGWGAKTSVSCWREGTLGFSHIRGRKNAEDVAATPVAGAALAYKSICRTKPIIPPINSKSLITYDFFYHLCYG